MLTTVRKWVESYFILFQTGEMRLYHAACIEEKLGLNRESLIAMALLLGSDYTDGTKNIGYETAIKLLGKDGALSNTNVLERYTSFRILKIRYPVMGGFYAKSNYLNWII